MRKRPRLRAAVRGTFLAIILLALAVAVVASSRTFQACVTGTGPQAGGQDLAHQLAAALQLAGVYRDCSSEFLRQNGEAITAALVVVLVFPTLGLWWAVRRLWLSGADHLAFAQETTRDAVVAIRQSLSSMERAFVFVESYNLRQVSGEDPQRAFHLTPLWKNAGKTRTVRARHHTSWAAMSAPMANDFAFPDVGTNAKPLPLLIGPGVTAGGHRVEIPHQQVLQALEGRTHLYVWGWCEYNDVFPGTPRHRTEFCVQIERVEVADGAGPPGQRRVSAQFTPLQRHNGADEDCVKPVQT
jgi:hypothetical protein